MKLKSLDINYTHACLKKRNLCSGKNGSAVLSNRKMPSKENCTAEGKGHI